MKRVRASLIWIAAGVLGFAAGWVARPLPHAPVAPASAPAPAVTADAPKLPTAESREALRWSALESGSYDGFLRNLRGIGCPEDILRDLVVAELYCDERGLTTEGAGPWNEVLNALPDSAKAGVIATEANRILGRSLLAVGGAGTVDAPPPQAIAAAEPASPVESNEAAYVAESDRLWAGIGMGKPTEAERQSLLDLESKRQVALEKTYDPEQLERYEVDRTGRLQETQKQFSPLKLSDDETVALIRMRDYEADDAAAGNVPEPVMTMRRERADAFHKMLGDDRYELYRRLEDPTYSMLDAIAQRNGVAAEATVKAYKMVSSGDVLPDAKGSFESELKAALGERGFQDWVKVGEGIQATLAQATDPAAAGKGAPLR